MINVTHLYFIRSLQCCDQQVGRWVWGQTALLLNRIALRKGMGGPEWLETYCYWQLKALLSLSLKTNKQTIKKTFPKACWWWSPDGIQRKLEDGLGKLPVPDNGVLPLSSSQVRFSLQPLRCLGLLVNMASEGIGEMLRIRGTKIIKSTKIKT